MTFVSWIQSVNPQFTIQQLYFQRVQKENGPLIMTILCLDTNLVFYLNCLKVDQQVRRYVKALSADSNAE